MTSEIRTNSLTSRAGLSTVTLSDTGPIVTGIATFGVNTKIDGGNNVINVGTALTIGHTQGVQFNTQNLHSNGFEVNNINASGIITATSFKGDGSNLTGLPSQVTISNNADNRVITGGSGTNLNGEQRLTYNGSSFTNANVTNNEDSAINVYKASGDNADKAILRVGYDETNSFKVWRPRADANIYMETSQSSSNIIINTNNGSAIGERLRITSNGRVHIRPSNTFYTMNTQSTDLVIGDGGGGRGITFWTAGAADNQTISFQTNENLSRAEGEISYGPTATSVTNDRNAMMFRTNSAERLRITSAGDVGIGTAVPVVASNYGNLSLAGNTGGQLELKRLSNDTRHYIWGNDHLNIAGGYYNGSSSSIRFYVNGSNERLRIGSNGGHTITCSESHYSANLSEMNTNNLALNIIKTRQGQTKGIGIGAIGNTNSNTGIQCYDTSNNGSNPLLLNPFGGNVGVNITSPTRQLEIYNSSHATVAIKGDVQSSLFFSDSADTNIGQISYMHTGTPNNYMYFRVNDGERLRIGSAGQIGLGGANYGSSGQVLTSQGSGSAVQWASPSTSTDPSTGTANNNIWHTVGSNITWHTNYNNTDNTIGSVSNCNQSNVYAIDVKVRLVFNNSGGSYNYNNTHAYINGYIYQDGKNYFDKGTYIEAQHFDLYYNVFGTVYTMPWDPSGTQNLKVYCTYAYNTSTQNYFNFQVINKWTR